MSPKNIALPPLSSLRPFRSFLFLKLAGNLTGENRVTALRNAIADLVPSLRGARPAVSSPRSKRGELYTAVAVYVRERRAPWTTDPAMLDLEHHLVAVSGCRSWCAVFMSDDGLREALNTEMVEGNPAFDDFSLVSPTNLNAVFVKGRARALWLSSVQRRSTLRADHKVLSGMSLEDALDPLGDQAYIFTAARC